MTSTLGHERRGRDLLAHRSVRGEAWAPGRGEAVLLGQDSELGPALWLDEQAQLQARVGLTLDGLGLGSGHCPGVAQGLGDAGLAGRVEARELRELRLAQGRERGSLGAASCPHDRRRGPRRTSGQSPGADRGGFHGGLGRRSWACRAEEPDAAVEFVLDPADPRALAD